MKKNLFIFLVLIGMFMFCSNVKAETYDEKVTLSLSKINNNVIITEEQILTNSKTDSEYYQKALEYIPTIVNTETEYYIVMWNSYSMFDIYKWSKDIDVKPYLNFTYKSSYISTSIVINPNKIITDKFITRYSYYFRLDYSNNGYGSKSTINHLFSSIGDFYVSSGNLVSSTINRLFATNIPLYYNTNTLNNLNLTGYYSPTQLYFSDENNKEYKLNVDDVFINDDLSYSFVSSSYEYENLINTTDLDKIEFSFKIPTDNNTFSFDLELLTQFSDIYLSKPYLEYSDIYSNVTISQIDDFLGERTEVGATDINGNELYQYDGTFGIDFNELYELRLVFDVSNYTDDLYVKFTSSLDYDVNYINSVDVADNYVTVMMNDKYGIYLIPKVLTSDNFSNINLNGKYNIEIRNNYNGSEQYDVLETYKNYIEPNFQYKYTFNNLNYLIYFENTEYNSETDDSYYIKFDKRYYNYTIKEFMFDEPTINNPNTNEDYILNDDYTFEVNTDESFFSLVNESFESFIPCIKEIFNLITIYFNGLPLILKCFYIFVFFMILAYLIIKFMI